MGHCPYIGYSVMSKMNLLNEFNMLLLENKRHNYKLFMFILVNKTNITS